MPVFLLSHLGRIETQSLVDAPVAPGSHPVLVFSHGLFAGYAGQNTALMQALASHGYVIFAIEHAHWGLYSRFSDVSVATVAQPRAAYRKAMAARVPGAHEIERRFAQDVPAAEMRAMLKRFVALTPLQTAFYREGEALWVADQRFVLDTVARLDSGDPRFRGRLDSERIGVLGMSFGGAVAMRTCSVDERCRAGLNMDGFHEIAIEMDPIDVPFMYMDSSEHSLGMEAHASLIPMLHDGRAYLARVEDAEHFNYSDLMLFSPLFRWVGQLGPIDDDRMFGLTSACVLAFFDAHLRGKPSSLLQGAVDLYPEIRFVHFDASSRDG